MFDGMERSHCDPSGECKSAVTGVDMLRLYHPVITFMGKPWQNSLTKLEEIADFKLPQHLEDKTL